MTAKTQLPKTRLFLRALSKCRLIIASTILTLHNPMARASRTFTKPVVTKSAASAGSVRAIDIQAVLNLKVAGRNGRTRRGQ